MKSKINTATSRDTTKTGGKRREKLLKDPAELQLHSSETFGCRVYLSKDRAGREIYRLKVNG